MSIYQLANNNSFLGFTDNRTALQAGKIEKCLSKAFRYNGVVMERRDKMLQDLRNGKEPKIAEETVNGQRNPIEYIPQSETVSLPEQEFSVRLPKQNMISVCISLKIILFQKNV